MLHHGILPAPASPPYDLRIRTEELPAHAPPPITEHPKGTLGQRTRDLFPFRAVVAPWIASRALSIFLIITIRSWPFDQGIRLNGFALWDGQWYTAIARFGYGVVPLGDEPSRWPFFPLIPGIMRGFDRIGLNDQVAMVVVNHLALLVAMAGVYRLACRHTSARAASLAVWAIALFPASFIFSMLYPSAIFLAATVWAFVLVEDRHDLAAASCAVVATLARPNGVLLVVALVIAVRSWRRAVLVAAPAGIALALWMGWLWDRAGDPFIFWSAKSAWPEVDLLTFGGEIWRYDYAVPHFALGVAALWVVWNRRRNLSPAWIVWTVVYLLPPLAVGIVGMGRYANECFPPFIAAGDVLERWSAKARRLTFALSFLGLVFAAVMVIRFRRIP